MNVKVQKVRCVGCNSLLLIHGVVHGIIDIQCPKSRCKKKNLVVVKNGVIKIREGKKDDIVDGEYVVV